MLFAAFPELSYQSVACETCWRIGWVWCDGCLYCISQKECVPSTVIYYSDMEVMHWNELPPTFWQSKGDWINVCNLFNYKKVQVVTHCSQWWSHTVDCTNSTSVLSRGCAAPGLGAGRRRLHRSCFILVQSWVFSVQMPDNPYFF